MRPASVLTMTDSPYVAIVDDSAVIRDAMLDVFRLAAINAEAFGSAHEFLESNLDRASCLLLDVYMPVMTGLELQAHLGTIGRRIPIVFMSANHEDALRQRALRAGAVAFLTKPFTDGDLLEVVRIHSRSHGG